MSWLVEWKGQEWDVDPSEFTGLELSDIKIRTGYSFRELLFDQLPNLDVDAWRAIWWTVERRGDPDLKFSEYAGPPIRMLMLNLDSLLAVIEELGKAIPTPPTPTTESDGSDRSASSTAGAVPTDIEL